MYKDSGFEIERNFFGARHGKNPCDALGGLVKNSATRAIQSRRHVIQNAYDFFNYACNYLTKESSSSCDHMKRTFQLICASDMPQEIPDAAALKTIPGTRKLHSLRPTERGLKVRNLSCYCRQCLRDDFENCTNKHHVDQWTDALNGQGRSRRKQKNLNTAFLCSDDQNSPPVQKSLSPVLSRQSFFDDLICNLEKCVSYEALKNYVSLISQQVEQFSLPEESFQTIFDLQCSVDSVALKLIPESLETLYPALIESDGNCVARAISLIVFGTQDNHVEIRCRIIIDSVINSARYLSVPQEQLDQLILYSDHHKDTAELTYQAEILSICKLSSFMGLWQFMAAANAVQRPIMSIYPQKGPVCCWSTFNTTFYPCNATGNNTNVIVLMWSSCRTDMTEDYWVANHIVPLLPLTTPMVVEVQDIN